ncbi:phage antirepressor N-terminal domain-containing protein [Persephonella sp.]|uniref:phage antirepressor N-terminal domain-containing protein n=1 Tax=Persephonella sp. TaxID=2060922 RepID=UPI0026386455|nr:phage antirepressor N-terminal domain-containing protein [Persephonella sp.]
MATKMVEQALIPVEDAKILSICDEEGEVWAAVRHISNYFGLNWGSQWRKLKFLEQKGVALKAMEVEVDGNKVKMIFINLYDLPVYLYSININKVRPELRDKIKKFQVETTHAIREYWKNKIKKEREEIEKLKAEYNQLVQELRQIPTYEEYKELKIKYELLSTMVDMLVMDMENAKPYVDNLFGRIKKIKEGVTILTNEGDQLVKKIVQFK